MRYLYLLTASIPREHVGMFHVARGCSWSPRLEYIQVAFDTSCTQYPVLQLSAVCYLRARQLRWSSAKPGLLLDLGLAKEAEHILVALLASIGNDNLGDRGRRCLKIFR